MMRDVAVIVTLACGCRRYHADGNIWSACMKVCDLHGDVYDVVWIERAPGG